MVMHLTLVERGALVSPRLCPQWQGQGLEHHSARGYLLRLMATLSRMMVSGDTVGHLMEKTSDLRLQCV